MSSATRPKVLHIVDTLGMGGAETWLMEVLRSLSSQDDGPQMDFLATSGNPGIFDDEARVLGARVFYLRFSRGTFVQFVRRYRRLISREAYDVIHDHQGFISGWHFLAGLGLHTPVRLAHIHSAIGRAGEGDSQRRFQTALGAALVSRLATEVLGTSRQVLAEYGLDTRRFEHMPRTTLYCGFRTSRFNLPRRAARAQLRREFGWPAAARVALVAGRLDPWPAGDDPRNCKNSGFAVRVAIGAARTDPQFCAIFAGERGPAIALYEDLVQSAGLGSRIRFLGVRRDIEQLMRGSDALLFPSHREGLGMVAVEAQAAGLPVLASSAVPRECAVAPELVQFLDVGLGDQAWATQLVRTTRTPPRVARANELVARSDFAIEQSVRNLLELYTSELKPAETRQESVPVMKVLHVVDTLSVGGVETWMMEVLRAWRQGGPSVPKVDFVATSGNPGVFDDEARALGSRIFYVRFSRGNLLSFVRDFRAILRRGGYAAIHDHQGYVSGWHFLMGAGRLPPIRVTHVHNPTIELENLDWTRSLSVTLGKQLVRRFATHIAGTSRQLIREYGFEEPAFSGIPAAALHCGFEPGRFAGEPASLKAALCEELGWPEDCKIMLFAGRIDESPDFGHPRNHKNSALAVSIAIECAQRDPSVRMLLAGAKSPAVAVLTQRIADAGLSDRIRFLGVRRDIARLMLASDLLLFPSRGEGLGMVAVEAQAAGLPVLASTAVPRECVVAPDLVHFLEIDAGVSLWADEALKLIRQPRAVEAANELVARSPFSIAHSVGALERLYTEGALGQSEAV